MSASALLESEPVDPEFLARDEQVSELLTDPRQLYAYIADRIRHTDNLADILPLIFRYNGEPVTLNNHQPFETAFYINRPRRMMFKCARQVGKSFTNAQLVLLRANMIPNWNILYITPQFDTVRRFSSLYIKTLIEESPIRRQMYRKGFSAQVLQRTLANNSTLFFNYASNDANRTRGTNSHENFYDEVQLITSDTLDILAQTMGGSPFGEYETYAGTPLSPSNIIDRKFSESTMSVWMIKCRHCGYENRAALEFDLLKMIGPLHEDISEKQPGLVCARCSKSGKHGMKSLYTDDGRWYHRAPERRQSFLGLHIPQPIMKWHAHSYDRWLNLHNRLAGGNEATIFNESLGESADTSFKPVSMDDLRRAAVLPHSGHDVAAAQQRSNRYLRLVMGIDWGGGGMTGLSLTKAAILGFDADGRTDVLYGIELNHAHRPAEEVKVLTQLARLFKVHTIAHDAGGGVGATRETMMRQNGVGNADIWSMSYTGAMKNNIIVYHPATADNPLPWYSIDKSQSLMFTCQALKQGHLRTFKLDYVNDNNTGLLHDFTSLYTDVSRSPGRSDILIIDREEGTCDDFAHAVNLGAHALWSGGHCYPKLSRWAEFEDHVNSLYDGSVEDQTITAATVEASIAALRGGALSAYDF